MASYNESRQVEEVEKVFRQKLEIVASEISPEHLSVLLFACKEIIPDATSERITKPGDLFLELERRGKLSLNNKEILCHLLGKIGLDKLSQDLEEFGSSISPQVLQKIGKLKKQGRISFKEKKYDEANEFYSDALSALSCCKQDEETAKQRLKILQKRMQCYIKQQNFKPAESDCIEVLSQNPEDWTSKVCLVESLLGLKEYDKAIRELDVLIKARPKNPDVLLLYKKAQSVIKFEEADKSTSPISPESDDIKLGDSYPRKILLVCDKWSGWHLDIYTVNRHLCRSFARMKDVQVACLVLEVSDKDKCKASREEIFLIKAANRSGIPEGDTKLLFMHDQFPFDPDLVIGHGMITGAEAAELARKFKCKYLQVFYDTPENCKTHFQNDSDSLTRAKKEMELGNSADFVAAIGPQMTEEWSNMLKRHVIEIIPGISDSNSRNSVATPNRRCLIFKSASDEDHRKLNFATNAFIDCKKRGKQIRITVQGASRTKKADFKQDFERKLSRSNFDVHVTSFDASIESIEGEVRVASLVLMPEPSESFGLRCLEAFSAGVPALVNNSFGIAHLLLNCFDEKFWAFVRPFEEPEDDHEQWSDRIDEMLDKREQYFDLAADLRKEWSKKFTWDSVANKILVELERSGFFDKLSKNKAKLDDLPSASLCSAEARKFVVEEMNVNNKRRKLILAVSPADGSRAPSISHLSKIPWISVFDFDVNSAETGYLASCGSLGNEMGMKICRIIPPVPEESKQKVTLLNGVPWFLLEGTPESNRSMSDSLEWLRNIFVALENAYHVPITMVILWDTKVKKSLAKNLVKLLNTLETSSLKKQIKLAIVATNDENDGKPSYLEDIEEDWKTTIHFLSLLDFCNAVNEITMENPVVDEGLDFALPIANSDGNAEECITGILPHDMRWINAELEVLYHSVGNKPIYEANDALHFYRGGTISWYALKLGHAIERENWEPIKEKIDELLLSAGTLRFKLPHQRGTGGTTSARKILFDFHKKYPCVTVTSISHTETAPAIKVLADFCKLPVIVLIDCKHVQGEEFDLDMLYNSLSNCRVPSIILEVAHVHKPWKYGKGCGKAEVLYAAGTLNQSEKERFVQVYSDQTKDKLSSLRQLKANDSEELQIPFYYALVTFEEKFTGLEPFVNDCLAKSDKQQRQVLVFLAMAHHYGHISVPETILTSYFNAPCGTVLEEVLTETSLHLLIEENGNWRPRHDLIGMKMLQSLLTFGDSELRVRIHPDNWAQNIANETINFISHMPEKLVTCLLLNRGITEEKYPDYFSQLINDIPEEDDAIKVFEKAIDSFPDNMFFKVHLGRLYSIKKKAAGFEMAIKYTDEGIDCADGDMSKVVRGQFAQMKGVVYSRQVNYLINQEAEIKKIIDIAEMGVKWFRRAVSICPDMVDGYIPEVSMMCKLFEYVDRVTGSIHSFLLSGNCHPFIVDGISQASDTLESVPDSENYTYWKARLLCLGLHKRKKPDLIETLKLLEQLRESGRASRSPVNRKIADMKMTLCKQNSQSLSTIASEVIDLLNEALIFDKPNEKESTMRIWVRVAPFVPVDLEEAENLIFKWCTEERSVRSYLFKYIIACIHVLENKGSRYYSDIMYNAHHDLNSAIKAINRGDVGRVRHPDRPVIWLGPPSRDMSQLVYLNLNDSVSKQRRLKNVLPHEHTLKLRQLTGTITRTDPKLGNISVRGILNVIFRTDLCDPPLTSANFTNRKVKFFLGFNFFGVDAFNVELCD